MKETNKMLEIIHTNRKRVYEAKLEKQIKENKEDKKFKILLCVVGLIAMIVLGSIYVTYNEKQITNCMESGKSETFCRYAGE